MPLTPQELKDKLLRTLDNDYNVVDMAGAREALSILEKYPITRETLEQTRLGRYVNEMRKRTTDKDFAKRIKNLVRSWQVLVTPGPPASTAAESVVSDPPTRVNGKAPVNTRLLDGNSHLKGLIGMRPTSPASRPETPCSIRSSISSPRSTHGAPPVMAVSTSRRDGIEPSSVARESSAVATSLARCASEVPLSSSRSAVASPLVGHTAVVSQHRTQNAKLHSAPTTPMNSTNLGGQLMASSATNNIVTSGKRKREDETSSQPGIKLKIMKKSSTIESEVHLKDCLPSTTSADTWSCTAETTAHKPPSANGLLASLPDASTPPSSASVPQTTPQVKSRRGRPPNSAGRKVVALDRASSVVSTTSVASIGRAESTTVSRPETPATSLPTFVPKVATTAELIQKLHASGDLRLTASETVKKIASNQIIKETLSENDSVVPAAAKPRPRKKNSVAMPPSTPDMMTMFQIKNEMVHKFLESSVPPDSPSNSLMNLLKRLDPPPDPEAPLFNDHSTSKLSHPWSALAAASPGPNRTADNLRDPVALDSPWDSLPPVDPDQIDWSTTDYVAPDPDTRPPVTDDDVERLHASQWPGVNGQYDFRNEWSDWTKTFSVSSYNGDLLHILPYVNIQD